MSILKTTTASILKDFHKVIDRLERHAEAQMNRSGQLYTKIANLTAEREEAQIEAGRARRVAQRVKDIVED